ncbi:sensor histidine kinase [Paenibacillus sp. Marseille-Q4541]|uniref:cache domain-containing sensor histidine kinase n=1 Tax=Paenibacillus sp. Marseille-Q4541 TaxID=2831522 RepID=UPI0020188B88|nr:sensor histidine kinase [Paenibacillus sp. Marseille-Q4541]
MLSRLVRLTNDLKLKHKLVISYVIVVMIPVLIIGLGVTYYFRQQAVDQAIQQAENNVDRINNQTMTLLRVPTDISNLLMFNNDMKEIANTRFPDILELTRSYHGFTLFNEYLQQYRELYGIRFFSFNSTLVNNHEFIPVNTEIQNSPWFKEAMSSTSIGWFYIPTTEDNPADTLSLVRGVQFPEYQSRGVLMVLINRDELNNMLSQEPFNTMIVDNQGYIVAAKDTTLVGSTFASLNIGVDLSTHKNGLVEANVYGEPSNIIVDEIIPPSSMNGFQIVSIFSTESIVSDANQISLIGMLFIILVLLFALALVYVISLLTTNRLLRLSRQLNRLALGDLNVVSHVDGNDEIGQLSRQFNHMVTSINELMGQVVDTSEQNNRLAIAQKEIKLKMMASQINPHFLFNALESIRMKAHIQGEVEIANIVRLLGKLIRKNLEIGSGKTTIKAEMEMVRSYLQIQKFRYEDRLDFDLRVEEDVERAEIPPLIIQPLVENAIVHGLENKEEGVKVEVYIFENSGLVHFKVRDNGMGIKPDRLKEVILSITGPEEEEKSRIGLRNVHQRLTLSYGEEHGLIISSEYGKGTEIDFTVPKGGR